MMGEEVDRLFERARRLDPGARAELLERACPGSPDLRSEILSLLEEAEAA